MGECAETLNHTQVRAQTYHHTTICVIAGSEQNAAQPRREFQIRASCQAPGQMGVNDSPTMCVATSRHRLN